MLEQSSAVTGGGGTAEVEASAVTGGGGMAEQDSAERAVTGGGGMLEQDGSAVLGGGGIAEQDGSAVFGGGGMLEQDRAVGGGGGITDPLSAAVIFDAERSGLSAPGHTDFPASPNASPSSSPEPSASQASDSILIMVLPIVRFRNPPVLGGRDRHACCDTMRQVTDRATVSRWLAGYEAAWRAPGTQDLVLLFTADATYLQGPYEQPVTGLDAISRMWEAERDGPSEVFTLATDVLAVDGPVAVVRAEVRYGEPLTQEYRDLWVIRFTEDGRCTRFEEWPYWPEHPYSAAADPT